MSSFSLSGGVEVYGFISPTDTNDQYPVIDPLYGIDGLRNINTLSDLDSIPTLRRRAGMIVGVSGGTSYYKLNLPPWTNTFSDWSVFNSGGVSGNFLPLSGGTVSGGTEFTNGLTANTISASTYLNLPSDIYVTAFTYSNNIFTLERSSGNPNLFVTLNDVTGLTINGDLIVTGTTYSDIVSASTYQNLPIDVFVTGGTYSNGNITFTNNTGGTFSVNGLFTGSTDVYVTGGTYNDNTFTFTNNTGGTFDVSFNSVSGLTINGDLNVTGNTIVDGITANTISASTYQNLPIDVYVTGGTYSLGTATFTNNTGGTFNVSGFFTGSTDNYITGGTFNKNTETLTLTDVTGGTINISGFTDIFVTGGTYSNGNITFTNNTGGTFSVSGLFTGSTDVYVTGGTYSNGTATFTNNTGGTFNVTGFVTGDTDTYITGFTYSSNTFNILDNSGTTLSATINEVTGFTINGNLTVNGNNTYLLSDNVYIKDNEIIINYNPTGTTTGSSISSGVKIQDGNGIISGDTYFNIGQMNTFTGGNVSEYSGSTGYLNRGWITQLNDIVIRNTNMDTSAPNGYRIIAENDTLDGGTY